MRGRPLCAVGPTRSLRMRAGPFTCTVLAPKDTLQWFGIRTGSLQFTGARTEPMLDFNKTSFWILLGSTLEDVRVGYKLFYIHTCKTLQCKCEC